MTIKKILLIDDDRPTNFIHRLVIQRADIANEVIIQQSAKVALELLRNCSDEPGNFCPELILLDINMPGMDGWEFLDEYEALPAYQQSKFIIVMLTTSLNPVDRQRAEKHPYIQGFINKPLTVDGIQTLTTSLFPS